MARDNDPRCPRLRGIGCSSVSMHKTGNPRVEGPRVAGRGVIGGSSGAVHRAWAATLTLTLFWFRVISRSRLDSGMPRPSLE